MSEDAVATSELSKVQSGDPQSEKPFPVATGEPRSSERAKATGWRRRMRLRRDAPWWLYVGVITMMIGFALIAYAWLRVAPLANVALQIPYVISSAVAGLALVLVGLGIVDAATRRIDARERSKQLGQLRDLLAGIADSMELGEEAPALAEQGEES